MPTSGADPRCNATLVGNTKLSAVKGAYEQTKCGYTQAFFKKLRVAAEWDDGETVAWISGVELTPLYALLLTEACQGSAAAPEIGGVAFIWQA